MADYRPLAHASVMTLLKRLLSTTRMPGAGKDRIVTFGPAESRNLLVIRNGQLFSFDAVDAGGDRMSVTGLARAFSRIIAMTDALQVSDAIDPELAVNLATPPNGAQRPGAFFQYNTYYVQGIHFGIQHVY